MDEIDSDENRLENLLPPVKDMAQKYGGFPVIVAGGIYTYDDIIRFMKMGADGVQMGTRFLATEESSATVKYKQAVVDAREDDIIVAHDRLSMRDAFQGYKAIAHVCLYPAETEKAKMRQRLCSA